MRDGRITVLLGGREVEVDVRIKSIEDYSDPFTLASLRGHTFPQTRLISAEGVLTPVESLAALRVGVDSQPRPVVRPVAATLPTVLNSRDVPRSQPRKTLNTPNTRIVERRPAVIEEEIKGALSNGLQPVDQPLSPQTLEIEPVTGLESYPSLRIMTAATGEIASGSLAPVGGYDSSSFDRNLQRYAPFVAAGLIGQEEAEDVARRSSSVTSP
jgi:hypothetical protein